MPSANHVVTGDEIDRKKAENAIRLSEEMDGSVGAMIRKSPEFEPTFELREVVDGGGLS